MAPIKDSNATTVVDHKIDLRLNVKPVQTLTPDAAQSHLDVLASFLTVLAKLIPRKLPQDGGNNPELLQYIKKFSATLRVLMLKHTLESMKPNSDIRLACTINPSDSGFPVFIRDFKFLATDKEQAVTELEKIPGDERLVDDALFLLFRGLFPKEVILQKFTRSYYDTLKRLALPEALKIYPVRDIKTEDDMHYCKRSWERLDDHHNLPRFYTAYLKIPAKTYPRAGWRQDVEQAITEGLSTVVNLELGYLAQKIDDLEGVQLEYLERFDLGPFYSPATENRETVRALVEAPEDAILMFSKAMVIRTGQEERAGVSERLKSWLSGDEYVGKFSPTIESPQYILMPHRLIQKVHNLNITLKDRTQMFGIEDF
jgi:hypothetical protein